MGEWESTGNLNKKKEKFLFQKAYLLKSSLLRLSIPPVKLLRLIVDVSGMLEAMDTNSDKGIDFDEFMVLMIKRVRN